MNKPSLPLRLTSALCATALTAAIPILAHKATYTGAAGLPIVRLERVVVIPPSAQAQTVAAAPRRVAIDAVP